MQIEYGKYTIRSTALTFEVSTGCDHRTDKNGKTINDWQNVTYHSTLLSALEEVVFQRMTKDSKATTIKELMTEIREMRKELKTYMSGK